MIKPQTLSLCMIVKNEEHFLAQCLESIADVVDEIIIVDTGSTDYTLNIAKQFGAQIYYYEWNNDFSAARNFSISKASMDWILILDADEKLDSNATKSLIHLINTSPADGCNFLIYNYIDDLNTTDFTIHFSLRLIKNNHHSLFTGAIHEQLTSVSDTTCLLITREEILIHHYGYLASTIQNKNKRNRNIPLILKELEKKPQNPYYLFCLGNEYLAQNDYRTALSYYGPAIENLNSSAPYYPKLMFKIILCAYYLKDYEGALYLLDSALTAYPEGTDFEYYRGLVLLELHKEYLAQEAFKHCLLMGPSPSYLSFLNGCGTFRPLLLLAESSSKAHALDDAIFYYNQLLHLMPDCFTLLYPIAHLFNEKYTDKLQVATSISSYFSNLAYPPNHIIYIDILLEEKLVDLAQIELSHLENSHLYALDYLYLLGKFYLFTNQHSNAYHTFTKFKISINSSPIIVNAKYSSLRYLFYLLLVFYKNKSS